MSCNLALNEDDYFYIAHLCFRSSMKSYQIKLTESYECEQQAIERMKDLAWVHSLKKKPFTKGRMLVSDNGDYMIILLKKNEFVNIPCVY